MPDDKRPVIYDENLNFFRNFILQARLVWLLMTDRRVPLWLKALPLGSLAYLFMPIDAVPDVVPILGQLDDLAVLLLGMRLFVELCPSDAVAEHMQILTGHSPEWKVKGESKQPAEADEEKMETTVIDGTYTEPPPSEEEKKEEV